MDYQGWGHVVSIGTKCEHVKKMFDVFESKLTTDVMSLTYWVSHTNTPES